MVGGEQSAAGERPDRRPARGWPSGDGELNLDTIEVRVDPRAEWKQIFDEAWRINRDFFYDPNMHGADWTAVKTKYEPFLPHVTVERRPLPRHPLDALANSPSATVYTRPASALYEQDRSAAACSVPITRSPTAATASRRSTAG